MIIQREPLVCFYFFFLFIFLPFSLWGSLEILEEEVIIEEEEEQESDFFSQFEKMEL